MVAESDKRSWVELEWRPDADAVAVGTALRELLIAAGWWQGVEPLDWPLALASVQSGLKAAVESRRKDADAWHFHGQVFACVGTTWFLTTAGVEVVGNDLVLMEKEFPTRQAGSAAMKIVRERFEPTRPPWAGEREWQAVIELAHERFPLEASAIALRFMDTWQPSGEPPDSPG